MKNTWVLVLIIIFGCRPVDPLWNTQPEYKNNVHVSDVIYHQNSAMIIKLLNEQIAKKTYPFNRNFTKDYTNLIVDTIVYNQDKSKMFFFLIFKYTNTHAYEKRGSEYVNIGDAFHFDAFCFLAKRAKKQNDNPWKLYCFDFLNAGDDSSQPLSNTIRRMYFHQIATFREDEPCRYNFDDIRMWNEPLWNRVEE